MPLATLQAKRQSAVSFTGYLGVIDSESEQRRRTAVWWNATSGRVSGRAVCFAAGRLAFSHAEACAERPLHHVFSDAVRTHS